MGEYQTPVSISQCWLYQDEINHYFIKKYCFSINKLYANSKKNKLRPGHYKYAIPASGKGFVAAFCLACNLRVKMPALF